jgi:hypothetical protein
VNCGLISFATVKLVEKANPGSPDNLHLIFENNLDGIQVEIAIGTINVVFVYSNFFWLKSKNEMDPSAARINLK